MFNKEIVKKVVVTKTKNGVYERLAKANKGRVRNLSPEKKKELSKKQSITIKKLFKEGKMSQPIKKGATLESTFGKKRAKEIKTKISNSAYHKNLFGENNSFFGKTHKEKIKKLIKKLSSERWEDEDYRKNTLISQRKALTIKPNKPEQKLIRIVKKYSLPFNYVGDGKIWFRGANHSFNPDFLSKNPKHIIEVFGDYWYNLSNMKKRDKERVKTYTKYGYKTLIIWEHELNNPEKILNKIKGWFEYE